MNSKVVLLPRANLKRENRLVITFCINDMKFPTVQQPSAFIYGRNSIPKTRTGCKVSGRGTNSNVNEMGQAGAV
jgi:hypothetical protein